MSAQRPSTIVLGVTGGIAAYKACEIVRLLRKAEVDVHVILTAAAARFITPLTLETLSGHEVLCDLFAPGQESSISHIDLADRAHLLLVAPASADAIARLALGLADDALTTVALACRAPLLLAPAMNVNMWEHPRVQENLRLLVERGAYTVGPDAGPLACGWVGAGRMIDPQVIVERALSVLAGARDLAGRRVLVSAGPTHEPLDAVRFLGNRSSGKMGFAIASAAARRGAEVVLVAGPVSLPTPPAVTRIDVMTAAEMADEVLGRASGEWAADLVIMAAAVADFRPAQAFSGKRKKEALGDTPTVALTRNIDILGELGRSRRGARPVLVGFAAETEDLVGNAIEKLLRKGCDLLVANDVGRPGSGFGSDTNQVVLLSREADGQVASEQLPLLPKAEVAERILTRTLRLLPARP